MVGFPHLLKVMVLGEMAGMPHAPPQSERGIWIRLRALQKLASSVWTQVTQACRLLAPWDPRGGAPAKASFGCPQSQTLPAVYGACKLGSWKKALPRPRVEGRLGAVKALSRGGLQRYRGEDLKDGGLLRGKAEGWKTRVDNRHSECEAERQDGQGRTLPAAGGTEAHPHLAPGRDRDAKEQSQ